MKTKLYTYLLLISTLTNHYISPISIEQPMDEDYQQTFAVIYNVGWDTYKNHFQQILSPEQVQNIHRSYESTLFQSMWNSRHILPAYQNRGIGQQFISTIINTAKNNHPELNSVVLKVLQNNAQAIRCYEKAGFEVKEVIMYKKI